MSYQQSSAIRTAITELLRGSIGDVRIVPAGLFEPGVFDGQKMPAQQSKAIDHRYVHRFDLKITRQVNNAATPLGVSNAPYRIADYSIAINITTRLKAVTRDDAREEQRAQIEGDCDVAIQALNYRSNLSTTLDAQPTGIVSGLLKGPDTASTPVWELVEENWEQQLLRSRIVAEATVIQQQAVS
jgi:hypothetical protein